MEGYYLPEARRLVLFWSQVTGRQAGGKLMVIVLKHLAKLSHVEHLTTEGTMLEMARVCDWNVRLIERAGGGATNGSLKKRPAPSDEEAGESKRGTCPET